MDKPLYTETEEKAIAELCEIQGLSRNAVLRLAIRNYQLMVKGVPELTNLADTTEYDTINHMQDVNTGEGPCKACERTFNAPCVYHQGELAGEEKAFQQSHVLVCNHNHQPIGGPGCICVVVNQHDLAELQNIVKFAIYQNWCKLCGSISVAGMLKHQDRCPFVTKRGVFPECNMLYPPRTK